MEIRDQFSEIFDTKQRILVVMAHPDDAEIMCGGTIARLAAAGKQVRVIKMTNGNKGSRQNQVAEADLVKQRIDEDASGLSSLGVKPEDNISLALGDGEVEADLRTIGLLAHQIRLFKPDLIITHNPEQMIIRFAAGENWVNHRDHRHTAQVVVDAAYPYSRDILFFPEQLAVAGVSAHIVTEFLFIDSYNHQDEVFMDITDFYDQRVAAVASHGSQFDQQKAADTSEFLTSDDHFGDRKYERFRYVKVD